MVDEGPCRLVMEFIHQVANAVARPFGGLPHVAAFGPVRLGGLAYEVVQALAEALDPAEGALGDVSCVCFREPGDERPYPRVQGCCPVPFPAGLLFQVRVVPG